MNITLNGKAREVQDQASLQTLVENPDGIAVALNGEVVRAADWASTVLNDDDAVEIVTARQGG